MILKVEGTDNKYYVQTLCMIFFPGSRFSESEQPSPDNHFRVMVGRDDYL